MNKNLPPHFTEELIKLIIDKSLSPLSEDKEREIFFALDSLDAQLQNFVNFATNNLYNNRPIRISYCVTVAEKFGAFCYTSTESDTQEKFDFVAISMGTLCILYDNFTRILNSPFSLLDVGNPTLEDPDRSIGLLSTLAKDRPFEIPLCPIRADYAKTLTMTAVKFIIYHEITHLYRGHLDWKKSKYPNGLSFMEDGPQVGGRELDLNGHYLEIDADRGAIYLSITEGLKRLEMIKTLGGFRGSNGTNITPGKFPAELIRTLVYSFYVMFRSTDMEFWRDERLGQKTHPRGMVRARYMVNKSLEFFRDSIEKLGSDEEIIDLVLLTATRAEQDVLRLENDDPISDTFQMILKSETAQKHILDIGEIHWKMTLELKPYMRGTLLPD